MAEAHLRWSNSEWQRGDIEASIVRADKAVQGFRGLARGDFSSHALRLAHSLIVRGNRLALLGRTREAIASIREAIEVERRLLEIRDPSGSEGRLVERLSVLGALLAEAGETEGSVEISKEAVERGRQVFARDPEAYVETLAELLDLYGLRLYWGHRFTDAAERARESIELIRRLIRRSGEEDLRAWLRAWLCQQLRNYAIYLVEAGLSSDALSVAEEAVALAEDLTPKNVHRDRLRARTLHVLAERLMESGRGDEAVTAAHQAITLYQDLSSKHAEFSSATEITELKDIVSRGTI